MTVRRVELMPPRGVLGKNTVEALQSGIIYGFAGQIDGSVERICDTVPALIPTTHRGGHRPLAPADLRGMRRSPTTTLFTLAACVRSTNVPARTRAAADLLRRCWLTPKWLTSRWADRMTRVDVALPDLADCST